MSFAPLENPIGFGAADFIEFSVGACLILLILFYRPLIEAFAAKLAQRTFWCVLFLFLLPIALRLALLPHHPVPSPDIYDEFGHLLVADTLRHFRLANPAHPLHQFFETFFVLQKPTYSPIYPIGQGLALAIGKMISGTPWAGVVLSTAAFCSLCYWMLRAWTTPEWSLLGGLFAVFEFGPLSQWMNTYWGGSLAAAGGCLVFGALPRLRAEPNLRNAALLSLGLSMNLLIRPYESIFLLASAVLFLIPDLRRLTKPIITTALLLIPALAITALQNFRVTGNWTTLPYTLSQYQYGVPAALTFQSKPVPHNDLTPQQRLEYQTQLAFQSRPETLQSFLLRLEYRVRFYRFFFLPPLLLTLPFFLYAAARERRFAWVAVTLLIFALGINFFPAFQFHYLAAVTCLFVLASITGLQQLDRLSPDAAHFIAFLCIAYFTFWYTMHIFDTREFSLAVRSYETWSGLNHRNPERRLEVNRDLGQLPGQLLVFVHYSPQHIFQDEWVYNEADLDHARIVWARDLGEVENGKLRAYYPGRTVLLLEPDMSPPLLTLLPH
jgi:hypothetical protein